MEEGREIGEKKGGEEEDEAEERKGKTGLKKKAQKRGGKK